MDCVRSWLDEADRQQRGGAPSISCQCPGSAVGECRGLHRGVRRASRERPELWTNRAPQARNTSQRSIEPQQPAHRPAHPGTSRTIDSTIDRPTASSVGQACSIARNGSRNALLRRGLPKRAEREPSAVLRFPTRVFPKESRQSRDTHATTAPMLERHRDCSRRDAQ